MEEARPSRAAARAATQLVKDQLNPSRVAAVASKTAISKKPATKKAGIRKSVTKKAATKAKPTNNQKGTELPNLMLTSKMNELALTTPNKKPGQNVPAALPHNLGPINSGDHVLPSVESDKENQGALQPGSILPLFDPLYVDNEGNKHVKEEVETGTTIDKTATQQKAGKETPKKEKAKKKPFVLDPGVTPYPDYRHPTVKECDTVTMLLSSVHGEINAPATIPEPSLTVTGCGEVPSVLDALIRTLLSGATSGNNSALAFDGLVKRFGILKDGIGKGSVNWDAVRRSPIQDVETAMVSGGLAPTKSRHLKKILDSVYEENQGRRNLLLSQSPIINKPNDGTTGVEPSSEEDLKAEAAKGYEIACANQHFLTLNHLHNLPTPEVMKALTKYDGIGPKTAACVILFCLQRPCFAVDTHIFRICRWLRWVPDKIGINEEKAFVHLDAKIPDRLKYSLHQLFIRHGQNCPRCRAITGPGTEGWDTECVIEHLVDRKITKGNKLNKPDVGTKRKMKAETSDGPTPKKRKVATGGKKKVGDTEEPAENEDEQEDTAKPTVKKAPKKAVNGKATPAKTPRAKNTAAKAVKGKATPAKAVKGKATPAKAVKDKATPAKVAKGRSIPARVAKGKATPAKVTKAKTPKGTGRATQSKAAMKDNVAKLLANKEAIANKDFDEMEGIEAANNNEQVMEHVEIVHDSMEKEGSIIGSEISNLHDSELDEVSSD